MDKYIKKFSELPPKVGVALSYIICINICAFARNSLKIILWYMFRESYQSHWLIVFFNSMAYSIMFLCGCLTGFLIHKNSIFHSSLAVALGVMFTYLVSGIGQNEYILLLEGALTGAVLGGIGGGGALIIRKFWRSK
ncbi:hypothetical protein K7R23_05980 [Citrobacter rodentium NBRC 105723 = DSM 16636]|uniref:Membrane protein n=2 Tax=Citrobacter rodentium TaxID=67825 RepID=D2TI06_CITRI|nr:hypothetical protein [Citrobacter rodentium]QBY30395.1 hypothetical protein E2R62_17165 [Citrobacter rodentium]UHO32234.1 hypothetical protein K7R23_05980 [Citrobacter rodentium NBRC 105723 = DSM 16636]CBG90776.1 putative membrane protein [Citrobacter rodentium ICC168]